MSLTSWGYVSLGTGLWAPLIANHNTSGHGLLPALAGLSLGIASLISERRLLSWGGIINNLILIVLCLLSTGVNLIGLYLFLTTDHVRIVNLSSQPVRNLVFQSPNGTLREIEEIAPNESSLQKANFQGEGAVTFRMSSEAGEQSGTLIDNITEESDPMRIIFTIERDGRALVERAE